jgi:hypothetical protein
VDRDGVKSEKLRGLFGDKSFGAWVGDGVRMEVEFSEPAYAYLLVFNPNPRADLREEAWPKSVREAPPLPTRQLDFPDGRYYRLTDGPGLEVFAVVASRSPLLAHSEWLKQRGDVGWNVVPVSRDSLDVVWTGVGGQVRESIKPDVPRGEVVVSRESDRLHQLLRRLESAPGVEAAALVAIMVEPRP